MGFFHTIFLADFHNRNLLNLDNFSLVWLEQFYYLHRNVSAVIHIWECVGFIDWEDHQKSSLGLTVPLKTSLLPTGGFKLSSLSKSLPASNLENIIITLSSKSSSLHVGIWGLLSMFSSYLSSCPVCTMCCSIYPTPFPLPVGELNSQNDIQFLVLKIPDTTMEFGGGDSKKNIYLSAVSADLFSNQPF